MAAWSAVAFNELRNRRIDPVVTIRHTNDQVVQCTATFAPRIALDPEMTYSHTFQMKNEGLADLEIRKTSKSCDCLSAEIENDKKLLSAGETVAVKVGARPNKASESHGSFFVQRSDGVTFIYQIVARTYPLITLDNTSDDAPVSFGLLAPGSTASTKRTLFVYSYGDRDPPMLKVTSSRDDSALTYKLTELGIDRIENGRIRRRRYELKLDVHAASSESLKSEKLLFKSCDPEEHAYEYSKLVTWNVRSLVVAAPESWLIRRKELSTDATRHTKSLKIVLCSIDDRSFRIIDAKSDHESISAVWKPQVLSQDGEIDVALDPSRLPETGLFLANVDIHLDLGNQSDARQLAVHRFRVLVTDE